MAELWRAVQQAQWLKRYRHWLWALPLALVLVNGTLLSMYRAVYAGRVGQLREQYEDRKVVLASLTTERQELEAQRERVERNQEAIAELYDVRLGSLDERLTTVLAEVKALARRSGLEPGSITYPEQTIEEHGLVKKSIVFSVEGSYLSLRRFVNLLELSESFLVLEGIQVRGADANVRISLTISTLFAAEKDGDSDRGGDA